MKIQYLQISVLLCVLFIFSCDSSQDSSSITTEFGQVFVTSNTNSAVTIFDFSDDAATSFLKFNIASTNADGIVYDRSKDQLIIASKSNNSLEVYSDLTKTEMFTNLNLKYSSTQDFSNPAKIAKSSNKILVVQNGDDSNNNQHKLFVYRVGNSSATLINNYNPQFDLWDVQFAGNNLYAVQDNSDSLAAFNNILDNADGFIPTDIKVQIEGITRTHAFHYVISKDVMLLTDIGDENNATDGAIHIIKDFSSKLSTAGNRGSIALTNQLVIKGDNTELGNPVGITYDAELNKIYVAEGLADGGKLLQFDFPTTNGNQAPIYSQKVAGAASVYYSADK